MAKKPLLPIKVVLPSKTDYEQYTAQVRLKEFVPVTAQLRKGLADKVDNISRVMFAADRPNRADAPGVVKVALRDKATAKSYRPTKLFDGTTCPPCGVSGSGTLFVTATNDGLVSLKNKLLHDTSNDVRANISTIQDISAWTASDALHHVKPEILEEAVKKSRCKRLRIRLFNHQSDQFNLFTRTAIEECAPDKVEILQYGSESSYLAVKQPDARTIRALSAVPGARSLDAFPDLRIVRTKMTPLADISPDRFTRPIPDGSYGLVGIIDTGTDRDNEDLQAWVVDRLDVVGDDIQNNDHGSFVAGLIASSRSLNGGDQKFPSTSCRIVDVAAIDESGEISEYNLTTVVDQAINKFPDVRIWNLSLGLDEPCCLLDEFSPLACFLDDRARRHNVLFVIAAGNFPEKDSDPHREFPPQKSIGDRDRICPPADAVRGLTVGSVAHKETANTCVRAGDPSPFGRRGPGSAFLVKPELAHYGGNCDSNGDYVQTGVVSLAGGSVIAEHIGTSFSCPLVSSIAGHVFHELNVPNGDASPMVVKALLIHSAMLSKRPTKKTINYMGVGIPKDGPDIIGCSESSATMMLRIPMRSKRWYFKHNFPMPRSLVDGNVVRVGITMTVLHDCPLDDDWGIEYCRTNLRASLGVVVPNEDGEEEYKRCVEPVVKRSSAGPEKKLIESGFKYSPLKLFSGDVDNIDASAPWRLKLWIEQRSGVATSEPGDAIVLVTLSDPRDQGKVYNELVREMGKLAWNTHDLQIRSRPRLRP